METKDVLAQIIRSLLVQLPVFLVCCAGIVAALVLWSRSPRASLCVLLGLGLDVVLRIVMTIVYAVIPNAMRDGGSAAVANAFLVANILHCLLAAVIFALLLLAVFIDRRKAPAASS